MDLLTAKDMLPQAEAQLRAAEMERNVCEWKMQCKPDFEVTDESSDFDKALHDSLTRESEQFRLNFEMWVHKTKKLRAIYDDLKATVDAEEKAKA